MILAIETSGIFPSVGIVDLQGNELYFKQVREKQTHAEQLGVLVSEALNFLNVNLPQSKLLAIAINEGPGSYTGLRIGSSLAKGLCYSMQLPLIAVKGMTGKGLALLENHKRLNGVWVMLDARRDEVYATFVDRDLDKQPMVHAAVLPFDFNGDIADKSIGFVGDCIPKVVQLLALPSDVLVFEEFSSARDLYALSVRDFTELNFKDVAYFEPFYLKEFEAGKSKKFIVN